MPIFPSRILLLILHRFCRRGVITLKSVKLATPGRLKVCLWKPFYLY